MEAVRLHFPEPHAQALRLTPGTHDIGSCGEGLGPVTEPAQALLRFSMDRRGIWVQVLRDTASIHVNGRQVHQTALLRPGDVVHVDAQALQLAAPSAPPVPEVSAAAHDRGSAPCLALRAHGGRWHGRCFSLERPLLVGSSARADIHLDAPEIDHQHARLQWVCGQLQLNVLGAGADCMVNGHHCREAVLQAGDQVLFGRLHRFVLEAPQRVAGAGAAPDAVPAAGPAPRSLWPLTWLLIAAMALAGLLAGLLLFGEV